MSARRASILGHSRGPHLRWQRATSPGCAIRDAASNSLNARPTRVREDRMGDSGEKKGPGSCRVPFRHRTRGPREPSALSIVTPLRGLRFVALFGRFRRSYVVAASLNYFSLAIWPNRPTIVNTGGRPLARGFGGDGGGSNSPSRAFSRRPTTSVSDGLSSTRQPAIGSLPAGPVTCPWIGPGLRLRDAGRSCIPAA